MSGKVSTATLILAQALLPSNSAAVPNQCTHLYAGETKGICRQNPDLRHAVQVPAEMGSPVVRSGLMHELLERICSRGASA